MGSPDGGWYDDTPPYVLGSTPADKSVNVSSRRVNIYFNEYIKLEDAQNKVIVSPPQIEMPEIKAGGKRIIVDLKDSLKQNTTYTIDFSDAISDNNEGNPMGNYTFSFSTGKEIDTLEVSGYVLNAENLEPIKGIQVGLYDNLSDTVFKKEPMIRISRTDSRGRFTVKGVAPGTYRAYALQDADGDFVYNQKSEMIAFNHETFEPSWKPDTRQDTIWRDSLHIDNILRVPYTHFLPDDITLLAFTVIQDTRYLVKTERQEPNKLGFYFSYGDSLPPVLRGLNFNADSAFVVEPSAKNDTIFYWLRDTTLINQDTLLIATEYRITDDSTGVLINKPDTLELLPKMSYERRMKEKQKEMEKWLKEQEKKKKDEEPYDSIYPVKMLEPKFMIPKQVTPTSIVTITVPTPLAIADTTKVHLYSKIDTLWYRSPFEMRQRKGRLREYELVAQWNPETEYSLEVDSAAFVDIYGLQCKDHKQGIKPPSLDEFSTLMFQLTGVQDTGIVVQLIDKGDKCLRQERATANGEVVFYYLTPETYYARAFIDRNGNNLWDTGEYDADLQPEDVYYYSEEIECKAKWDVTKQWNLTAKPRHRQKPGALVKAKGDKERRKLQNRNAERAKQLGKEYVKKSGVKL